MVKKQETTKKISKTVKKTPQTTEKFQPNLMTLAVSAVAVISLFVLAYLTASHSL